jgi:hypothetical protein
LTGGEIVNFLVASLEKLLLLAEEDRSSEGGLLNVLPLPLPKPFLSLPKSLERRVDIDSKEGRFSGCGDQHSEMS